MERRRHDRCSVDRRTAIKWMLAAAAMPLPTAAFELPPQRSAARLRQRSRPAEGLASRRCVAADVHRGAARASRRRWLTIIFRPTSVTAASAVGVVDFIDEWISAPYPDIARDRDVIVNGLRGSTRKRSGRFKQDLREPELRRRERRSATTSRSPAGRPIRAGSGILQQASGLIAGGFYTTPVGMKESGTSATSR